MHMVQQSARFGFDNGGTWCNRVQDLALTMVAGWTTGLLLVLLLPNMQDQLDS